MPKPREIEKGVTKREELHRATQAREAAEAAAGPQKVTEEHRDVVKRYKGQQK